MTQETDSADDPVVGSRWPELGVAGLLLAIGVLVVVDSLRVGTGWGDDGPRSGYFPFYIGLLLITSSGFVLLGQLLRRGSSGEAFAQRSQLASVLAVFIPMVVYVVLIAGPGAFTTMILLVMTGSPLCRVVYLYFLKTAFASW